MPVSLVANLQALRACRPCTHPPSHTSLPLAAPSERTNQPSPRVGTAALLQFRMDVWDSRHTADGCVPYRRYALIWPRNPLGGISNQLHVLEVSSNHIGQKRFHRFRQITCCICMVGEFPYHYAPFSCQKCAVISRGASVMALRHGYARYAHQGNGQD